MPKSPLTENVVTTAAVPHPNAARLFYDIDRALTGVK
jgi:hypothetical protein